MDDLTNLPKVEITADLTEVANRTYEDTARRPLKSSSSAIATVIDFFHNTVLYPMQKYNLYATDKLQSYAEQLQNRAQSIPNEYLTTPRVNILGPAIEGLKYNLDEEYIKEMFTNILLSDMDTRKQNKVLPSYIEIVNQLSKEDVSFLKTLFQTKMYSFPLVNLRGVFKENKSFKEQFDCISLKEDSIEYLQLSKLITDNLERLQIISLNYNFQLLFKYDDLIATAKSTIRKTSIPQNVELDGKKGLLEFTAFGKGFIDICLS